MSRSLFFKSFREAVGATPIHYLKTVQLELAASLLRQTGLPLSEVAHRVGYKSDEAFLRTFQSGYGVTPGRFRSANSSSPGFDTAEPCMPGRSTAFAVAGFLIATGAFRDPSAHVARKGRSAPPDRKSDGEGNRGTVSVDSGGQDNIKK